MSSPASAGRPPLHPALATLPGHLLWRAHARVAAAIEVEQRAGVDPHAVAVLRWLTDRATSGDEVASTSQQDLAEAVGISRTTMTRVATALATQGLVERVRNPDDRRSYALTPTGAGAHAVQEWRDRSDSVETSLTAAFTSGELQVLADLLLRVAGDEVGPETSAALRERVDFLIGRAHGAVHRHFLAALTPLRLEPRLYGTLNLLAATGPIPQSDVARYLGLSGASVVQIADDLEELGLVERRRDPADRRAQQLHLQSGAAEVIAEARAVAARSIGAQLADLSPAEVRTFVDLLHRFVTTP